MDRIAAAMMIALVVLVTHGGFISAAQAEDISRVELNGFQFRSPTPTPVASGLRCERVLSLLIALEALRAAPEVLNRSKD